MILLAAFTFASGAQGAASGPGVGIGEQFSVSGIKVDATAQSPAAARDLAMKQGREMAWRKLFRSLTAKPTGGAEPKLAERELLGLILRSEAGNERRNTTRYVADVTFHFNPTAVLQLLRRSNIVFAESVIDPPLPANGNGSTHLAVNVRFDNDEDWAIVRERLDATKVVTGIDVVARTPNEAQVFLNFSGEEEQLQAALAQQALDLTSSEGQYTLELGTVSKIATHPLVR